MAGYSEALKDEEYFGTFNSEDILTAPSSEVPESVVIPPLSAHFLQDEEIVVLEDTIKKEYEVVDVEQGQIDRDEFKIKEQNNQGNLSLSFGLKVADFAVFLRKKVFLFSDNYHLISTYFGCSLAPYVPYDIKLPSKN